MKAFRRDLKKIDEELARLGLNITTYSEVDVMLAVLGLVVDDPFGLYTALALVFTLACAGAGFTLWLWARQQGSSRLDDLS